MNELAKIIERVSNGQATPSDEVFIFLMIFGIPVCVFSVVWIIKIIKDGCKRD